MKICLAQIKPAKGDIPANVQKHLVLINMAAEQGADIIIFPELSITGYEPALANELATTQNDQRFAIFQTSSNTRNITIAIGVPLKAADGVTISLLIFQPVRERTIYSKQYLHPDEVPYFTPGVNNPGLLKGKIALAICYELSVPEHAEAAFRNEALFYMTSVAKSSEGIRHAAERLASVAKEYNMTVLMTNSVGLQDGMQCAGQTSAWNKSGDLVGQLNQSGEGFLLIDTLTGETAEQYI